MRIIVHPGAHKTATTYIQATLQENAERLRSCGVGYAELDRMRSAVTPLLERPARDLGPAPHALVDSFRGCDRVILSDENMAGLCSNAVAAGNFYVRLPRRLRALASAVAGAGEVEILFATRAYDSFVSSMYCEYLRHRPFLTPAEYLDAVDVESFSWRTIVAALVEVAGEERVTLWRYEDFGAVEDRVFEAFCGAAAADLRKPEGVVRLSHSQRAIDALVALVPRVERAEIRRQVPVVAAAMPKNEENPAFSAFSADEAAALRLRYAQDLAAVASDHPRVKILAPAAVEPARPRERKVGRR